MKTPKLVKEYPAFLSNKHTLRLYKIVEDDYVCWYFGFPKKIIEPLCPWLKTSVYWDGEHQYEDGEFWLWQAFLQLKDGVISDPIPKEKLQDRLNTFLHLYNQCFLWLQSCAEKK